MTKIALGRYGAVLNPSIEGFVDAAVELEKLGFSTIWITGGPLYAADPGGQLQLVGVTSFTVNTHGKDQSKVMECHGLALFTDVRANLDWINAAVTELGAVRP